MISRAGSHPAAWYAEHGIGLRLSTGVAAIDRGARSIVLEDGTRLTYDALLLTTGARARTLPVLGASEAGVLYLRDIPDAERLAARLGPGVKLAVIGAGFIGLEVAASARLLGGKVHVVEPAPQPLGRVVDPAIRAAGDCTRHFNPLLGRHIRLESWQNAQNQAIAVARCMASVAHPHAEIPWFWSDQYDMNLQSLGLDEPGSRLVWRGDPEGDGFIAFNLVEGRIVAATGINRPKEMAAARRIIQRGVAVDPVVLADPATRLAALAKG
jgi:3-phenylpropionate/trans-cinnamate dioxygenase ferredoxin reductase subunit